MTLFGNTREMQDARRKVVQDGYDSIGAEYLAARTTDGSDVALLPEIISNLSNGDRVLDAGCGAGIPVTAHLVGAGLETVGLDFSLAQLRFARSLVPAATSTQADLAALPFRSESFQALVSYYAIIHVPRGDHHAIYREFHRVLEAGGTALLCLGANDLPEDYDPQSWLGTPMFWSHYDAPTNLTMLGDAGFRIVWHRLITDPMDHAHHLFVLATRL
jgi:ubiquinone/menaquinone biosynthesis C-methylase UbiE